MSENVENPADVGRFLAGVGALLWDSLNNSYLVLKRADSKDFAPNVWECVTGRVDQGESFEEALHREVDEEIGIPVVPQFIIGTTHFYRGDPVAQNELLGVIYCCVPENLLLAREQIRLSQEHSEFRWVTSEEAHVLLNSDHATERWLRRVINRAEIIRQYIPVELLATHTWQGFELDT
jgi:8-oxo-dGTP pyrophosphatase MutT (NUDIX family)